MSDLERGSEEIARELDEKRSELDETARVLEHKLSSEYLWEQIRAYLQEGVHSAGDLVRRHPIPTALAAAVILGGLASRSERSFLSRGNGDRSAHDVLSELLRRLEEGSARAKSAVSSEMNDGAAERVLNELLRRAEAGSERVKSAVEDREQLVDELLRRLEESSERAKSAMERSARSAARDGDKALHQVEDFIVRAVQGIEKHAPQTIRAMSQSEVSLLGAVATAIGVAVGTALMTRR